MAKKKSNLELASISLSELMNRLEQYKAEFEECREDKARRKELLNQIGEIEKEILKRQKGKGEESAQQLEQQPEKTYLVTTWKGALVGSFICLYLAALIGSAVEGIPTWTAIFQVAAWVLGIPLAMVSVGLTFAVLASKTKEDAMSNLLWIAVLAVVPLGVVMGLDPPGSEDDPLEFTILTIIFPLAWLTAAIGYFGKAVLGPWLREVGKEQVEQVLQELSRLEQEKKDEPKREPWASLSEAEIKEYLKTRGLKIDPTRYAPAQKSYGTISSMFIPMAEFMWKGVCPHCGWGICAIHVIGSFRALTKCEKCGELALLDRLAERFFAIVRGESGA